MYKTLINRAKTKEVSNIEGKLEHLKSVLQMNAYLKKFIDCYENTTKRTRKDLISVFFQYTIYWFSFTQNRKDFQGSWHAGILYLSSEDKLLR